MQHQLVFLHLGCFAWQGRHVDLDAPGVQLQWFFEASSYEMTTLTLAVSSSMNLIYNPASSVVVPLMQPGSENFIYAAVDSTSSAPCLDCIAALTARRE